MTPTSIYQAALYLVLALSVSALDPKYRSEDFLASREHGLDTYNIFHIRQCLMSSSKFNHDLATMYNDVSNWYLKIAGEHEVGEELCQQIHCAYDLRNCLHPSFTSLEFLEAVITKSVEVCSAYCQHGLSTTSSTSISNGASRS
ncbi:uncharacterized protein LOC120355490 [Nilaparvata lugens]|uniref:uncharacterized protein LOC120353397 n=1 Tax=Nilaparvata lugens TaxID=108931 RepID=UPI00193E747A|nr:uncharacterized protein LOC120353397 [Nilaparvata lugens]XP_039299867.1 uncharacterized protein LOC120355490 [Nilaparvata lugens]